MNTMPNAILPTAKRMVVLLAVLSVLAGVLVVVSPAHAMSPASPPSPAPSAYTVGFGWVGAEDHVTDGGAAALAGRNPVSIVSGDFFTLALTDKGEVAAWGNDAAGQVSGAAEALDNHKVTQVAAAYQSALAVLDNGKVVGWGDDQYGQVSGAAAAIGTHTAVQVAISQTHSIALLTGGTVAMWGENSSHQSDPAAAATAIGSHTVTAVAATNYDSFALLDDGSIVGWGTNNFGEKSGIPTGVVATQLSANGNHIVALLDDHSVRAWGDDTNSMSTGFVANVAGRDMAQVVAGSSTTLGVTTDGKFVGAGRDTLGAISGADEFIGSRTVLGVGAAFLTSIALLADPVVSYSAVGDADVVGDAVLPNQELTAAGKYLPRGTDVGISIDSGYQSANTETDASGAFSGLTFSLGNLAPGAHTLQMIVGDVTRISTIYVTSTIPVPTITGTARVGSTLTAVRGAWPAGTAFTYKWLRSGITISGATSPTYLLTSSDRGKQLQVVVTGVKGTAPAVVKTVRTSAKTSTVASGVLSSSRPTISGLEDSRPVTGGTLVVSHHLWSPSVTFGYQWYANGVALSGQTHSTLAVSSSLLDKRILVAVTGKRSGYTSVRRVSNPATASDQGTLVAPTPVIPAGAVVGTKLLISGNTWAPGTTVSYEWLRDGEQIIGATASTYTPTATDVGAALSVRVTGYRSGFTGASVTTAATTNVTPIAAASTIAAHASTTGTTTTTTPVLPLSSRPTVSIPIPEVTVHVGMVLTAEPGDWTTGSTFTYQWFLDGVHPTTGATASTFTVTSSALAKAITVRVTGHKSGFTAVTRTSEPTMFVERGQFATHAVTIADDAVLGVPLKPAGSAWTSGVTRYFQWQRSGEPIIGATGSTYTPSTSDLGKAISVIVSGYRVGYHEANQTSGATSPVVRPITSATPTITGTRAAEKTLTAIPGKWTAGTEFHYQWARLVGDTLTLVGADAATYDLSSTDVGAKIRVTVTGSHDGYTTKTRDSAFTALIAPGPQL
ncbi:MAG: putative surface-anchored protein [Glaciihabitans sp.]|nr:putative surface-anchored protein [Glaciihabitans sp.]